MSTTITELNNWLEEKIKDAEEWSIKNNQDTDWAIYYKRLVDLDKVNRFIVSSADFVKHSPLTAYLEENKDKYEIYGYSGYSVFDRKF